MLKITIFFTNLFEILYRSGVSFALVSRTDPFPPSFTWTSFKIMVLDPFSSAAVALTVPDLVRDFDRFFIINI